ncbi:MAG: acylneuraminate cytidylyltransferase family protein [Chitinophagales bacterium]|nr:acylneuraminate cytidylyltransferase family protein [Chitinophagales bacterium]
MKGSCLYLITARGGSKGLPKKNILSLNGLPIIIYSLNTARMMSEDRNICVSTDAQEIIDVLEQYEYKVPFVRPSSLATDTSSSEQVILHCIEFYKHLGIEYDYIVLLQPTSPLRTSLHVSESLKLVDENTEMIMSVKETDSNPYYVLFEEDENGILQKSKTSTVTRRQDLPKVYEANGAIYIINVKKFMEKGMSQLNKKKFVMNKLSSIDIDDEIDFKLCEFILQSK